MASHSERWLFEEGHLNLAYPWHCRLDLTGPIRDHSTYSKTRHGRICVYDLNLHLFETVSAHCIFAGLVRGEAFAVDALIDLANANRLTQVEANEGPPEQIARATDKYLEALDDEAFGAVTTVTPKEL